VEKKERGPIQKRRRGGLQQESFPKKKKKTPTRKKKKKTKKKKERKKKKKKKKKKRKEKREKKRKTNNKKKKKKKKKKRKKKKKKRKKKKKKKKKKNTTKKKKKKKKKKKEGGAHSTYQGWRTVTKKRELPLITRFMQTGYSPATSSRERRRYTDGSFLVITAQSGGGGKAFVRKEMGVLEIPTGNEGRKIPSSLPVGRKKKPHQRMRERSHRVQRGMNSAPE